MAEPTDVDQPVDYGQQEAQRAAGFDGVKGFEKQRDVLVDGITGAIARSIQFFFATLGTLAVLLLKGLYAAMGELDPAFGAIAATVIGNMFDVEVDAVKFANMNGASGRKQIGIDVGAALLKAMKGDAAGLGPGELEPGIQAAESFLGIMANLAIEGWAMDLVGEAETFGKITNLGELNDRMASIMGLGRLSRTVLRPFVTTLIATPATWAVNKQYRPKMLTVSEAIRANFRGDVDALTLAEIAARDGYGDDAFVALQNAERKHMPAADLDLRVRAGQLDHVDAVAALRAQGWEDFPANEVLNLEELKARRAHIFRVAGAAIAAYAEHKIDGPALALAIDGLGFDATTIQWLHDEADARRAANAPHLSHAEILAAVKANILNVTDYATWLSARGYNDVDAVTLELVLQNELNAIEDKRIAREKAAAQRASDAAAKHQALQARRDELAAQHADWTGTLGQAERLVVRNVMPATQYRQVLIDHLLSPGDADALVTVAVRDRDAYAAAVAKKAAAAVKTTTPTISIAALERATVAGFLTLDQLRADLVARKYDDVDVAVMVDLVQDGIAARAAALARTAAAAARLSTQGLSLSEVQRAVVDGVQTIGQYSAFLASHKFDPTSITTLVADMAVQLDNRKLTEQRHAAAVAKLAHSHLTLGEEEKAVTSGILTIDDYAEFLRARDFDAADVAILVALLRSKLP